jgi:hypothetical protein
MSPFLVVMIHYFIYIQLKMYKSERIACIIHLFLKSGFFLKKCVNLLQGVFYPGSSLQADQGVADKGIPSTTSTPQGHQWHQWLQLMYDTHTSPANLHESILGSDTLFYLHPTKIVSYIIY